MSALCRPANMPSWKNIKPMYALTAIDGVVEDGQGQQVPQRGDGPLRLTVAHEPVAEALSFQGVAESWRGLCA